jgi:hypothetical protein
MKSYNDWDKSARKAEKLIKRVEQAIQILVRQPVDRKLTMEIRNKLYDVELETDTVLSCIVRTRKEWDSPKYSVLPFKRTVEREGVAL